MSTSTAPRLEALIFGSIGTITETSALQRDAFNQAFIEDGLDWRWDENEYRAMLTLSGGRKRIAYYAEQRGDDDRVDDQRAARLHRRKTEIYNELLASRRPPLRPGVARLIDACAAAGVKLGFATTTSEDNIRANASAAGLDLSRFDVVLNEEVVPEAKPAPDAFLVCLRQLDVAAAAAVAIEDTQVCLQSAVGAGITCVATPGDYNRDEDFSAAAAVLDHLGDDDAPATALHSPLPLTDGVVTLAWLAELNDRRRA